MKSRRPNDEDPHGKKEKLKGSMGLTYQKKKNMKRLGGGGLSLEAFVSMKSHHNQYNPAIIKKQREFYKNAKYVNKYKKSLKQLNQQNGLSMPKYLEDDKAENGNFNLSENKGAGSSSSGPNRTNQRKGSQNLMELYEKKRKEEEEARREREAIIKAKKEEIEKAQARRKAKKEKMTMKTRKGQPVMKHQIEHILQALQNPKRS